MISKTFFAVCVPSNLARAIEKKVFLLLMKSSTFLQHLKEDEKVMFGQMNRTKIAMWVMNIAASWYGAGVEWAVVKKLSRNGRFCWWWDFSVVFDEIRSWQTGPRGQVKVRFTIEILSQALRLACPATTSQVFPVVYDCYGWCWTAIDNPDPEISTICGVLGALNTRLTPESRSLPLFDVT